MLVVVLAAVLHSGKCGQRLSHREQTRHAGTRVRTDVLYHMVHMERTIL